MKYRTLPKTRPEMQVGSTAIRVTSTPILLLITVLIELGPGYIERHPVGELVTAAVHGVEQLEFYFRLP